MKKIIYILFLLSMSISYAQQDISFTLENAQITNDGNDDYYEVDIVVSSTSNFYLGTGQFYINYNTDAFGTAAQASGNAIFEEGTHILSAGFWTTVFTDNTGSRLSLSYVQIAPESAYIASGNGAVTTTPTVLTHLKIRYNAPGQVDIDPMICFESSDNFTDLNYTACGGAFGADCFTFPGVQITDDSFDCSGAAIPEPACSGEITTWENDSWDNGTPDATMTAIINTSAIVGGPILSSFSACELIINGPVSIVNNSYISIENNITVNPTGSLFVSSESSLVQVQEDAVTINNGDIIVQKVTPSIAARNFFAMSSPMSAETRDGVYGTSRAVFGIIPSNFAPYSIDLVTFPEFTNAENFLDDDGDYLDPYIGNRTLPDSGIGNLVFPSPSHDSPTSSYTFEFTQGTLNSGIISVPINYNGPETTNNYNLLGNPYASAIDVTAFLNANIAVNEVYYWDHITNPVADLPGFGTSNFSMNDISMRNVMMGLAAVNGGTAPGPFMASGQGFGIKADQSEMVNNSPVIFSNSQRVTGNNTDFRSSETTSEIEKLWLNLTTSTYDEAIAQTAIGFTPNATAGFDQGYDSKRLGTFLSLFTNLDGEYLGIQGRESFNSEIELQLGFSTTIEETVAYTIGIDHLEGVHLENTPIFLIDHLTNASINLKENTYTFTANKGIQPERFTVLFEERDPLGIDEVSFRESVNIYPNPATDQVMLRYTGKSILQQLSIVDMNGKIVKTVDLKNFSSSQNIQTNELAKGVYFLHIIGNNNTITKKLIIR
ncbi:hypothetical protein GCM10011344_02440 [Dokdonia pacifica]|uniref:Por secretion system C-terminal sorting domain-containing protein n=1 Tax=Dokdonia pacifica TaxID=1627892 RepID=A0A238ZCP8_9FLAO|nr:T9SS type A sorting domain-containing protein [Dokdonia pacifica]GGG05488.1 hypothetical protein GCM10011344_02440 [Dokdonia pacifica]SNR80859.1 Por secretion system C-terminal sorting domain-containing protein [Dokdonia pacifica]